MTKKDSVDKELILDWIDKIGRDQSASVPILQKIQSKYGYLSREAMDIVVANTEITASQIYGVATFYSQFRLKPIGKHLIRVCHGTACHVRGADRLNTSVVQSLHLKKGEDTSGSGAYTLEDVACVGCCSVAPVLVIDGEVHGEMSGTSSQQVLKKHAKQHNEELF